MCEGLPSRQAHFRLSTQVLSGADHLHTFLVLVTFPIAVIQYPDESNLRKGLVWPTVEGAVPHLREIMVARA